MKRFILFLAVLVFLPSCKEKEPENTIVFTYTASSKNKSIEVWPLTDLHTVKINWGIGSTNNLTRLLNSSNLSASISFSEENAGKDFTATLTGMTTGLKCWNIDIKSIDIGNCHTLSMLDCSMNKLTFLDLSRNGSLSQLTCDMNQLSSLDLSNVPGLFVLNCGVNPIIDLDVSNNPALKELNCRNTKITELDLRQNIVLEELNCRETLLSKLDVSECKTLRRLDCAECPMTADALDNLFSSLPETKNGKINIKGTPGENDCDRSIAMTKGWEFGR